MPLDQLDVIFALSTLCQVRAVSAFLSAALVFTVSFAVSSRVLQDLVVRTYVAVVFCVIYIFIFFEESFLVIGA